MTETRTPYEALLQRARDGQTIGITHVMVAPADLAAALESSTGHGATLAAQRQIAALLERNASLTQQLSAAQATIRRLEQALRGEAC